MTDAPRGDEPDFDDILRAGAADADGTAVEDPPTRHAIDDDEPLGVDDLDALFGGDVEVLDEQHAPRTGEIAVARPDGQPAASEQPQHVDADGEADAPVADAPVADAPVADAPVSGGPVVDQAGAEPARQLAESVEPHDVSPAATPQDADERWQQAAEPETPFWVDPSTDPGTDADDDAGTGATGAADADVRGDLGSDPWTAAARPLQGDEPRAPQERAEPRGWMLSEEPSFVMPAPPEPDWGAIARTSQVTPLETGAADPSGAHADDPAPLVTQTPELPPEPADLHDATPGAQRPSPPEVDAAARAAQWGGAHDAATLQSPMIGDTGVAQPSGVVPPIGAAATGPQPPFAWGLQQAQPERPQPEQPEPEPEPTQIGNPQAGVPQPGPPPQVPLDPAGAARHAILYPTEPDTDDDVAQAAIHRVRSWLAREGEQPRKRDRSAARLAGLLEDPNGLDFAIGFVDRVVRPEDPVVSAHAFDRLSRDIPDFLDWYLKLGVTMGGGFGIIAPGAVIPIAKRAMRSLVSHLVIDATPDRLGKALERLKADGVRLNVNLLGEAVLGEQEAEHRLRGTMDLLQRDDVDYVSVKVSSMAPQLQMWAFDETVAAVVERLLPMYRIAATAPTPTFINLDMEEYRDLDLTVAVFQRMLEHPELHRLEAGIVLQAYLPDAQAALERLAEWARQRVDAGGAPIKVRIVKGANLAQERVDATVHDWPLAVLPSKADTDANYKRVLHSALQPESARAVRVGVAGHNLFDLAYAIELAHRNGTIGAIDVEMLLGMAAEHLDAIRGEVRDVLLYTPVVQPKEFDSAVAYLVRRLEENGSGENFMSGMFHLGTDVDVWEREKGRFLASVALLHEQGLDAPRPNRTQDRSGDLSVAVASPPDDAFENEPDTDASLAANRAWGRQILERAAASTLGLRTLELNHVDDVPTLERRIQKAVDAAAGWAARGAEERARILRDAAVTLGAYRGRLLEIMAIETGKTLAEGDPEISEAIDFARYYADQAIAIDEVEDAKATPVALTVVTPPWNFPVAIPAGGVTAALATGSAVIIKPAPQARRSAAVMLEALWEAGVPRDVLVLCDMDEGDVSKHLITHPAVGRLILTGSSETAALFTSWRPELPLLAETSGKNAIVVTPSADLDLAVADLVKSAFGHAGQKCSAASLGILVGSVATSQRFRRQLVDAVQTLRVGSPLDPRTHVGPVIEPASGRLLAALTTLGEGESWLVEPRQLDAEGRIWSPGVRAGVQPGSFTHRTEFFGPHLSLIAVPTLEAALEVQNGTDFGLTAGIHSLDAEEVRMWMQRVQAGNLYVNRSITGAIVRRQPFGGWRLSQVGPGAKAGGPNYLSTLVDWQPVFQPPRSNVKLAGLHARVSNLIEAATPQLDFLEFDRIRAGANSDQRAWEAELGLSLDVSGLGVERNVFRYRPTQTTIRLADDGTLGQLVRVLAAAARARATVRLSLSQPLPPGVERLVTAAAPVLRVEEIVVESDADFHGRIQSGQALAPAAPAAVDERGRAIDDGLVRSGEPMRRIRLAGSDPELRHVLAGNPTVAVYDGPITVEGRLELLPFLREQAISVTAHRFGNPDKAFATLEV